MERVTGVHLGEALRRPKALERLGEPRPGGDAGPLGVDAGSLALRGELGPGEHPHGLGEGEPTLAGEALGLLEPPEGSIDSVSIHLDPLAANERQAVGAGEQRLHLGGGQGFAVERQARVEVQQRVLAEP